MVDQYLDFSAKIPLVLLVPVSGELFLANIRSGSSDNLWLTPWRMDHIYVAIAQSLQ